MYQSHRAAAPESELPQYAHGECSLQPPLPIPIGIRRPAYDSLHAIMNV
jgi:hypothetical protein